MFLTRSLVFLFSVICAGVLQAQTPVIPTGHPRILLVGDELTRLRGALDVPTAAAARFRGIVDRAVEGENIYGYEAWYSAMMGVLTGQAKYCADAIARTEAFVAGEEALIAGGNRAEVAGDSYLYVGDIVGGLAMVYDGCWSGLTPTQRTRWSKYANQAVHNVWHPDAATWGGVSYPWTGWSVDNPVNNYYYSFLRATMLLGLATKHEQSDADTWIEQFRTTKIANQLVPTFNSDLVGGGSREGTGYGSAMRGLFNLYYLWEKSTGERIADLTPHTASSMPYFLHAMVPSRDRFAPIGDHARDSTASFYDYQREYLLALATLYQGTPMARRVRAELALSSLPEMSSQFNFVYDFLYDGADTEAAITLNTLYRSAGTGHVFMRSDWTEHATWLAQMTGPYTESHAHQDGLSFLLYKNGWLVEDANLHSHSGIFQGQEAHALVTQRVGGTLVPMYSRDGTTAQLTALAQRPHYTYSAVNAGTLFADPYSGVSPVESRREMVYLPPGTLVIFDRVRHLSTSSTKTFQLPTAYLPTISGRTAQWSNGTSSLKVFAVAPAAAALSTTSMPTLDGDFNEGYRLDISVTGMGETRFMNVLSVDGAVTSATGAQGNDGGVNILLADGRSVTLIFAASTPGGQIEIRAAGGQILTSEVLPTTAGSVPLSPPFFDVANNHWAMTHIRAIADAGITTGCGSGNYCPGQNVTREQMAAFIIRAVEGEPAACSAAPFTDVPTSNAFCKYVQRMLDLNITTGCGSGNYCPSQNVTREQMAAFIVRAVEGNPPANYCGSTAPFGDVPVGNTFCGHIKRLSELGITTGCGGGNYCPTQSVTRDQMAAFLGRAFLGM